MREWRSGYLQDTALVDGRPDVHRDGPVTLHDAISAHRERLLTPDAEALGAFVLPDTLLGELGDAFSEDQPLRVHVHVSGGAGALEPACRWADQISGLELASLGIALRDEQDLARNAGRVVAMLDHLRSAGDLVDEVATYVETPSARVVGERPWLAALDELAMADLRLTLSAGEDLAREIDAALDRELAFRCVGVGDDVLTPLRLTRAALEGAAASATLDVAAIESARRWLRAVGTGDVTGALRQWSSALCDT